MISQYSKTDCTLLELVRGNRIVPFFRQAGVVELADPLDSKSVATLGSDVAIAVLLPF